ncbi:hypothetical protein EV127DRAFT_488332 [Xylaria flabelliformis]|nr:hypothetical protein EV127DRAFT_488332 [Xylaria flabelliformis]
MATTCNSRQQQPRPYSPLPHYTLPTANSSTRRRALKSTSPSDPSGFTPPSSQPRSRTPKITRRYYPHVADTNPERTARLWKLVMAHLEGSQMPSYLRETENSLKKKESTMLGPKSTIETERSRATKSAASTTGTGITKSESGAKVTDKDFELVVLERHGITILNHGGGPLDMMGHFGLTGKPETFAGRLNLYKEELPGLEVWLSSDDKVGIAKHYHYMKEGQLNEAEFSGFAKQHIFPHQLLEPDIGEKRFLPHRTFELVLKPDDHH